MPCYSPITAYRSKQGRNSKGNWPLVFNQRDGYHDKPVTIPCGKCIGCKLEQSRQWGTRCMHESVMHETNCFLTLTYSDKYLPHNQSVSKKEMQDFLKRLRSEIKDSRIRYFLCGEYGEEKNRPHYHLCVFGYDFPDKEIIGLSKKGHIQYGNSKLLQKTWTFGYHTIGSLTFESACYVARYCTKKITGRGNEQKIWYGNRQPEFALMSTGSKKDPLGGIGKTWIKKYLNDVLSQDKIIIRNNLQTRPTRYYDSICEKEDEKRYKNNKQKRREKVCEKPVYKMIEMCEAKKLKIQSLKRNYENESQDLRNARQ